MSELEPGAVEGRATRLTRLLCRYYLRSEPEAVPRGDHQRAAPARARNRQLLADLARRNHLDAVDMAARPFVVSLVAVLVALKVGGPLLTLLAATGALATGAMLAFMLALIVTQRRATNADGSPKPRKKRKRREPRIKYNDRTKTFEGIW